MKENLAKLIKVKTIVTLIITVVFAAQVLRGYIGTSEFMSICTMVIAFYFGTQAEKRSPA